MDNKQLPFTQKVFILDTNVLLNDPNSLGSFGQNKVVIPIYVLEELDKFKRDSGELGRNSRIVSRKLDEMSLLGDLSKGIQFPHGGVLQVQLIRKSLPKKSAALNKEVDNRILAVALEEMQLNPKTTLITRDINLRIRARALGLLSENYIKGPQEISEIESPISEILLPSEAIDELFSRGFLQFSTEGMEENGGAIVTNGATGKEVKSVLARIKVAEGELVVIKPQKAWGLTAVNKEQEFALDLLLDDSVQLVALTGSAGTGKTCCAIAAGLQKVAEEKVYNKLVAARPIAPLGQDIGFLPGPLEEKLNPWMSPLHDNLEFLSSLREGKNHKAVLDRLFNLGLIQIEALVYIKGRSISEQFFLIDEAQDLSTSEMKAIITRAGKGTKIVIVGDIEQTNNPYVDTISNGLSYVISKFKGSPLFGYVHLTKGERSPLAEMAARIL